MFSVISGNHRRDFKGKTINKTLNLKKKKNPPQNENMHKVTADGRGGQKFE